MSGYDIKFGGPADSGNRTSDKVLTEKGLQTRGIVQSNPPLKIDHYACAFFTINSNISVAELADVRTCRTYSIKGFGGCYLTKSAINCREAETIQ